MCEDNDWCTHISRFITLESLESLAILPYLYQCTMFQNRFYLQTSPLGNWNCPKVNECKSSLNELNLAQKLLCLYALGGEKTQCLSSFIQDLEVDRSAPSPSFDNHACSWWLRCLLQQGVESGKGATSGIYNLADWICSIFSSAPLLYRVRGVN